MENKTNPYSSLGFKPTSSFVQGDYGNLLYHKPSLQHSKKSYPRNSLTPVFDKSSQIVHMPAQLDQDMDSLKLSIQADVTLGHRDLLRFKSNYYQKFFRDIENSAFNRYSTEITSLYKLPKVLRTLKVESKSRTKYASFSPDKKIEANAPRPNELSFLMELKNSPKSVLPKLKKKHGQVINEFEAFEKKLENLPGQKKQSVKELYHTRKKFV